MSAGERSGPGGGDERQARARADERQARARADERPGVTGIVAVGDEERNLEACLDSFAALCDELVVVDSFSTDRSLEIAKRYTERIVQRPWTSYRDFLEFAIPLARHRWVLVVDCDERVTPRLAREIRERVAADGAGFAGFRLRRVNHFLGRRIRFGAWRNDHVYRFFRKGQGWPRPREVHPGIVIDGPVEALDGALLHFPYPTLDDYFAKFNRYTSAAARDRLAAGERARWHQRILAPPLRFLRDYLLRLGLLDGYPGFVLALLAGFYVFVRYTKMWQMQRAGAIEERHRALAAEDPAGGARGRPRPPRH